MWSMLKWLVTRLAVVRWLFKGIGGLALLVPITLLLRMIGLPVAIVLGALSLPVLAMLFLFGLPLFLVLLIGGGVLAFLFTLLTFGLFALKIAVVVVLPVVLVWKLLSWIFPGREKGTGKVEGVDPA